MKVYAGVKEETVWTNTALQLFSEDGVPVVVLRASGVGHRTFTEEESKAIVQALIEALPGTFELPDIEYRGRIPAWVSTSIEVETGAGTVKQVRSSALTPDQIKRDSSGEIIVPARRKDETPEEKRLRRALRRLRNQEREAKGKK